jgi:hypothetical protein
MNEPPRLLEGDDDALKRMILRSSELDVPSGRSLRHAHALALGLATSTVAGVSAAGAGAGVATGAMVGSVSTVKTIAIWAAMGLLSGALVSGSAVTLLDAGAQPEARGPQAETAEIERAPAAKRPDPRAGGVPGSDRNTVAPASEPRAVAAFEDSDPALTNRPLPAPRSAAPSSQSTSPNSITTATPTQSAARFDSVIPESNSATAKGALSDELAQELAIVDRARSALRSGNAAAALELVSSYERSYKRPRFAPEASALRIEALIALGRRAEAARLARSFMANHPGHPRTVRLREFLGEAP